MNPIPPGVTIRWAPNPLRTRVELDQVGMEILWHRLKIKDHEGRLCSATFALDPQFDKSKTIEARVSDALKAIDLSFVLDDEKRRDKTLDEVIGDRADEYGADLLGAHSGDCTCVACSCPKCYAEGLLGIDTISGLGKHEASDVEGAFFTVKGMPERSLDEAIAYLRDYVPVYTPNPRWPEEDWQKHVPRWIEEGRRAFEWLDTYRRDHFAVAEPA